MAGTNEWLEKIFLPTPSTRRATLRTLPPALGPLAISTHALHEEGDPDGHNQ